MDDAFAPALERARSKLATVRADLRSVQDDYHSARLRAELRLLEMVEGDTKRIGTNEQDRKRGFDAAVEQDPECQQLIIVLRATERAVDVAQTELDSLLDRRRDHEWATRDRLADILCQPHVDLIGLVHD